MSRTNPPHVIPPAERPPEREPLLSSRRERQDPESAPPEGRHDSSPWHGRHIYRDHYPEDYYGYRGFGAWPFGFWLFLCGWLFPFLWLCGSFLTFSRNPYERNWGKICGMALLLSILFGTMWGIKSIVNDSAYQSY